MPEHRPQKLLPMRGKLALFVLLIVIGLIYSTGTGAPQKQSPESETTQERPEAKSAHVVFVIDGDTITLEGGEKVRLIGIDTPERGEDGYEEAQQALTELVLDKTVMLVPQKSNRDIYGRLLRDVYVDDLFVNLYLIEAGYATALPIPPDIKFADMLWEAQKAQE